MTEAEMKPIIAITMGDVCGVGPEIVARTIADPATHAMARPIVVGDAAMLARAAEIVGATFKIVKVAPGAPLPADPSTDVAICVDPGLDVGDLPFGKVDPRAGHAAYEFLRIAVEMAQAHTVAAIATAPLNKEALHAGGHLFPGHTEILAELTGTDSYSMMLATPKMKVIHLTTHVGLIEAIRRITPDRTYQVVKLAHDTLSAAGQANPRIAVCGINPHAGENGLFGEGEEEEKLIPGIERAQADGIDVQGPLPADTLFYRASRGDFDVVVACYHDQGHGPVKVQSIDEGVNITVGLNDNIIRTSVDHGTAFDIAGKGIARYESLVAAIRYAIQLAPEGRGRQAL
ncbi:4-hydroxythreonine-4-phosphate dehydrogenase PdxA [Falsirhodobacter halotolerans]|uniref:4-hydroxythreonine-4-phosphate dehydrogenase PdxA n=1 Tax=Falsirhodobacter halotolerans TaxID=1146892 RepID=UPI001FD5824D|nr:4-hydroxythreonine-4-phosphate dehydrogenase PdxA [Falsirhodobacter halotolerans]MCJ8141153.1 4-hydroxythreonine-4-phosphate dehydrogenase PdxA [Falsirhodobacter halotolerans]